MAIIKRKDTSAILENAFFYDKNKLDGLASNYSSIEDMMEKEFGMKKGTHYSFSKAPGKMSIWGGALKSKKIPACRFLNSVDAVFLKPGTLVRDLRPDADGTTYSPKFKGDAKAGASGATTVTGSSPQKKATSGKTISSKPTPKDPDLPETQKFESGGYRLEVSFTKKTDNKYFVSVSGGNSRVNTEVDIYDIEGNEDYLVRSNLAKKVIIANSSALFGLDFPVYVGVRNVTFEATMSFTSFVDNNRVMEFRIRSMEAHLRVSPFYVEVLSIRDAMSELETNIEKMLVDGGEFSSLDGNKVSPSKANILKQRQTPRARRLYSLIAEYILHHFRIIPQHEIRDTGYDFDAAFVIEGKRLSGGVENQIIAVELIVTDPNTEYNRRERSDAEKRIVDRYKNKLGNPRISRKGDNRLNQVFVSFEIVDENLIKNLIRDYSLDETFGFTVSSRINEYKKLYSSSRYLEDVFEKYFTGLPEVDVFEMEKGKNGFYECFFIFSPRISPDVVRECIEFGITVVYDEIAGTYLGSSTIEGVSEEIEEMRNKYF